MSNRQIKNKKYVDAKNIFLNPEDPKQKQYEAIRSIIVDEISIKAAALKFGYMISTMETLLSQAINNKIEVFPCSKRKPKTRKIPQNLNATIVKLRNSGMSAHDILQKLHNDDVKVSIQTSIIS